MPPKKKTSSFVGIKSINLSGLGSTKPKGNTFPISNVTIGGTGRIKNDTGNQTKYTGNLTTGPLAGTGVKYGTVITGGLVYQNVSRLATFPLGTFVLATPVERSKLKVPVSPVGSSEIDADTLFEDPKNSRKKFVLPKHALATRALSNGDEQFNIELTKKGSEYTLVLELKELPSNKALIKREDEKLFLLTEETGIPIRQHFTKRELDGGRVQWIYTARGIEAGDILISALKGTPGFNTRLFFEYGIRVGVPEKKEQGKPQLYRSKRVSVSVPVTPIPFQFDKDVHTHLYHNVGLGTGQAGKLMRIEHNGDSYYQYAGQPNVVYYLPDAFKLTRKDEDPFAPAMELRMSAPEGSFDTSQMIAKLVFQAAPEVNFERLEIAREAFRNNNPALIYPLDWDKEEIEWSLIHLNPEDISFELSVPRASGLDPIREERQDVVNSVGDPFVDELIFPIAEFQSVYDAMFGASAFLFKGQVTLSINDRDEVVNFVGRLNDMIGELFNYEETYDEANNQISVTLTNAIESQVRIDTLPVEILTGNKLLEATLSAPSRFPITLAPKESLTFIVKPKDNGSLSAQDESPDALFDIDSVVVDPDRNAILNLILDPSTGTDISKEIEVGILPKFFELNPHVWKLIVRFSNGQEVSFTDAKMDAEKVMLPLPLSQIKSLLNKENVSHFNEYIISVTEHNGEQYDLVRSSHFGSFDITNVDKAT